MFQGSHMLQYYYMIKTSYEYILCIFRKAIVQADGCAFLKKTGRKNKNKETQDKGISKSSLYHPRNTCNQTPPSPYDLDPDLSVKPLLHISQKKKREAFVRTTWHQPMV